MAAAPTKQQQLAQLLATLKKKTPAPAAVASDRPVLEEILYAILREGCTGDMADDAYAKLKETFFDWNEVRVSSVSEVADAIHGLPEAGSKSQRMIEFLQEVFEDIYSFDLGDIAKKGVKQAAKQLGRYKSGVNDFVVAWVTQRTLGGHAIPLDQPTARLLQHLGILDADLDEYESARTTLEHFIPKASGPEFTDRVIHYALSLQTAEAAEPPAKPKPPAKGKDAPAKGTKKK